MKVRVEVEIYTKFFFSNYFYFSFVRPNRLQLYSCHQQYLKCFDIPLLAFIILRFVFMKE